jgi:small subunit ribosomal protein S16
MLVIRFLRSGKKNQPSFKIVVVEKTKSSTSGRFIEQVGFYNPLTKEKVLREERIKYWISVGAKPLATVHNLLVSGKIVEGKKIPKHKKAKKLEEKGGEDKSSSSPSVGEEKKSESPE